MTDKELIKQEIERLDEEYRTLRVEGTTQQAKEADLVVYVLQKLENFIDSLPEESGCEVNFTTKNENLDEEIKDWIKTKHFVFTEIDEIIETARHFAEWQKQAMKETLQTEYEKGRFDMREEMMKDVVDAEIKVSAAECYGKEDDAWIESRFLTPSEAHNFVPNEKVKIAIIGKEKLSKTEQQ